MAVSGPGSLDIHAYCREVEAHLCRRNGGHLIRLVGPAFDLVRDWAEQGVPLSVVCDGIDRTVERAERKPGRRRPLRIEFCEGDVLDGYDRWRRAVGVLQGGAPSGAAKRSSLTAHIERVAGQLAALLGSGRASAPVRALLPGHLAALDAMTTSSHGARGQARDEILSRLQALDAALVAAADAALDAPTRARLASDAAGDLEAFRGRLAATQWSAALEAARVRLLRTASGLPVVSFE